MTTQTTYNERIRPAVAGMIQGSDYDTETGICESTRIPFGVAVSQGTSDDGVIVGGASEFFRGITVRDITLVHAAAADLDNYIDGENVGVLRRGEIWVQVGGAVAVGNAVHFNASTGVLSAAGGELLAGARWVTSAASGDMARVYLSGFQIPAAT